MKNRNLTKAEQLKKLEKAVKKFGPRSEGIQKRLEELKK